MTEWLGTDGEMIDLSLNATIATVRGTLYIYLKKTKEKYWWLIPILNKLFLTFCTFLCDPELSGIFQSEDLLWAYFEIKSLQKITKKKKQIYWSLSGVMGVEKFKLFFKTTVRVCWLGSTLGFSYRGYSTNLLHRPQITTVSDYVMSFWKQEGCRQERSFRLFVMISLVRFVELLNVFWTKC